MIKRIFISLSALAGNAELQLLLKKNKLEAIYFSKEHRPTSDEIIAESKGCEYLLIGIKEKLGSDFFEKAPWIKCILTLSSGTDHIDMEMAEKTKVPVVSCSGVNSLSVVNYTIKKMEEYCSRNLLEANVLVLGAGKIGSSLAIKLEELCKHVYIWTRDPSKYQSLNCNKKILVQDFKSKLVDADIISINVALNSDTQSLFKIEFIQHLKDNVILINTARSELLENGFIHQFFKLRPMGKLILDVYSDSEVLDISNPNLITTPHIAGSSKSDLRNMLDHLFSNVGGM